MLSKPFNAKELMPDYRLARVFTRRNNTAKLTLKLSTQSVFEITSLLLTHTEQNSLDARVYIDWNSVIGARARILQKHQQHLSSMSMFTLKYGYINDALYVEFTGIRAYSKMIVTILNGTAEEVSSVDSSGFSTLAFVQ